MNHQLISSLQVLIVIIWISVVIFKLIAFLKALKVMLKLKAGLIHRTIELMNSKVFGLIDSAKPYYGESLSTIEQSS